MRAGSPGRAEGQVVHRGHVLDLQVHVDGTCLHAVARGPRAAEARLVSGVDRAASDPSVTVRRLAAEALGSELGTAGDYLVQIRRPLVINEINRGSLAPPYIEVLAEPGSVFETSKLSGQPVRLRFAMRDADLFSFQFGE